MLKWLLFVAGSVALAAISRRALRRPGSHGFLRFFAWEALLALLIVNGPYWFEDRFGWHQICSTVLMFASLGLVVTGVIELRRVGRPVESRDDDGSLYAFERTTSLVTVGVFRYIRHPLYSSLLLLGWGIFFKQPTFLPLALALLASLFLWFTARRDEDECIAHFGPAYRDYMGRTKRFIPYLL